MKLYTYARSSAAFRTRIALNLKAVDYEKITVDLRNSASEHHQPDYLSVNPQGLVPTLITEDATIAQSLAIIEYLDETHPEPPLLPRAPVDRARGRAGQHRHRYQHRDRLDDAAQRIELHARGHDPE